LLQWRQPLNHLNLILNNLRLAHRNQKLTSEYLESKATEAEQQLTYMSTTIEDFSKFFATKGKQEAFDLKEVCEYAMKLVASRSEKKQIKLTLECSDDCVHTNYKNELVQVLTILLNNAFDAFNAQKRTSGFIHLRVTCNQISIEDNAGGISEEIIPYIFDPYFSTKNKKFGTGLGLYVATMLVKNLIKGELRVQNTFDGCCFTLSFSSQENHD
jgi:signal transduction histidine kinase